MLCSRNKHNIAKQLYSNKDKIKQINKKEKKNLKKSKGQIAARASEALIQWIHLICTSNAQRGNGDRSSQLLHDYFFTRQIGMSVGSLGEGSLKSLEGSGVGLG